MLSKYAEPYQIPTGLATDHQRLVTGHGIRRPTAVSHNCPANAGAAIVEATLVRPHLPNYNRNASLAPNDESAITDGILENKMMQRSKTGGLYLFAIGLMASGVSAHSSANLNSPAQSGQEVVRTESASRTFIFPAEVLMDWPQLKGEAPGFPAIRLAKEYKYEIPKAERSLVPPSQAPQNSASPSMPQPKIRSTPSVRIPQGTRAAPISGGSCEGCRNSCYVRWRVNCGTSSACTQQFVPCMRACWSQLCRR